MTYKEMGSGVMKLQEIRGLEKGEVIKLKRTSSLGLEKRTGRLSLPLSIN